MALIEDFDKLAKEFLKSEDVGSEIKNTLPEDAINKLSEPDESGIGIISAEVCNDNIGSSSFNVGSIEDEIIIDFTEDPAMIDVSLDEPLGGIIDEEPLGGDISDMDTEIDLLNIDSESSGEDSNYISDEDFPNYIS